MRLHVLGNGNFFSETNDSQIIESNRYYLKDCPRDINSELDGNYNFKKFPDINIKDVNSVILTHTHEDHIGSLGTLALRKYFMENKKILNLYTTQKIYDEMNEILDKTMRTAEFDYNPETFFNLHILEPHTKYTNYAIDDRDTTLEIRYNLHPAVKNTPEKAVTDWAFGFKISDGDRTYADSGDTLYDEELIDTLLGIGKISQEHADYLKGFLWDADFIAHECTGSKFDPVHTQLKELEKLPDDIKEKLYLKHVPDGFTSDIPILQPGETYRI